MNDADPDELKTLIAAVSKFIKHEHIGPWLDRPNDAFSGRTPRRVVAEGEGWRIREMILGLETGGYL